MPTTSSPRRHRSSTRSRSCGANISDRLTRMARLEQASQARDAVLETLLGQLDIEVPEQPAEHRDRRPPGADHQPARPGGLTLEQYLVDTGEDQTEDEFWADIEERAAQALKAQIMLDKVAEERAISVDQNDLTQHIVRKAQADGVPPQQVADHLQGAPASHRGVHARDPPRQGARPDRRVRRR